VVVKIKLLSKLARFIEQFSFRKRRISRPLSRMNPLPQQDCVHQPKLARGLCHNCYHREWRKGLPPLHRTKKSPEERRAIVRAWKEKHLTTARRRSYRLKALYDITSEQFAKLKAEQQGRCAACGEIPSPSEDGKETLFVDHDHATGRVRALLCHRCNIAVGWVENCEIEKILAYLRTHKEAVH
jgi:hypothetical protein